MDLSLPALGFTAFVAGVACLSILAVLSRTFLHEIALFELKRDAARLRAEHERRLADLKNGRYESAEMSAAA